MCVEDQRVAHTQVLATLIYKFTKPGKELPAGKHQEYQLYLSISNIQLRTRVARRGGN